MIIPELKKYIEDAYVSGLDEEEIIINLLNNGWDATDIDFALKDFSLNHHSDKLKEKKQSKNKVIIPYILIIIGVSLILFSFYIGRSYVVTLYDSVMPTGNTASIVATTDVKKIHNTIIANKKYSTLLFVGDIMLSKNRGVWKQIEKHKNIRYPFLNIADILRSADFTFGNLEGPISSRGSDLGAKYSFRADPSVVGGLVFAGFDLMSIANNHIFDWGKDAFNDTISVLMINGIDTVGGGANYTDANTPVIKNINGVKVAFFAYSTVGYDINSFLAEGDLAGKSYYDLENTEREIKKVKESNVADVVVVSFHWGDEYKTRSDKEQQDIAHALVKSGADIIIGHHPHVVQEVERYKKGWIAYSLGNFIFDQDFSKDTMRGLMLKVIIDNKSKTISRVEPIDIKISDTFQPSVL